MSDSSFALIVCPPGEAPVRHDLVADSTTIGRGPDSGIQILVSEVSVRHGAIIREGDSYRCVDTGSTNGTLVNGASIDATGVVLHPMAQILFGTVIPAYFIPCSILATTPIEELIASLQASAKKKTAPVSVIAQPSPVRSVQPVQSAVPVSPGGATVRLDQVRPPVAAPGVRPPVPAPAGSGPMRPPGVAPGVRPPVAAPPGSGPMRPPGVAPGVRPPVAAPPGVAPSAVRPHPVPLAQPDASAPTIPLPKKPGT